jgi:hypothetical protein
MTSETIEQTLGVPVGGWLAFGEMSVRCATSACGLYVVRTAGARRFGRLVGDSDIIYVGSGKIAERLKNHTQWRTDFKDKGWFFGFIANCEGMLPMEFGCFPCENHSKVESQILFGYLKSHRELPPANLSMQLLRTQKGELALLQLSPKLREEVLQDYIVTPIKHLPIGEGKK